MNTNIRNSPTHGSRRNAAVSYDISRHLPINQLPPMQSHQHVNPRDVVLSSMPQFMRMMFANDTRRLRNPRSRNDNIPLTPPGLQHPSNRTLQRVTALPPGVPPPGLSTPSQFKVPLNILYLRILETMFRPITNTRPIPVYLRVKGIVSSDELGKRRVHPPSPRPLHKPRP